MSGEARNEVSLSEIKDIFNKEHLNFLFIIQKVAMIIKSIFYKAPKRL